MHIKHYATVYDIYVLVSGKCEVNFVHLVLL